MEGYVVEIIRMKDVLKIEKFLNKEYEFLKFKFDEICKERDFLQCEVVRLVVKR